MLKPVRSALQILISKHSPAKARSITALNWIAVPALVFCASTQTFALESVRGAKELNEVVVTGSLIASERDTLLPVKNLTIDDPNFSTAFRLNTALQTLPQTAGPDSSLSTGGFSTLSGGLSTLNLRGLGARRTLVLIDGKRMVGGDPSNPSVVDLNAIPANMIERVEMYTGGATAAYGSGAVAGVVNIITKAKYEGLQLGIRTGVSSEGDGKEVTLSLAGGTGFAEDKGKLNFNLAWDSSDPIYARDRAFSNTSERLGDRAAFSPFTATGMIVTAAGPRVLGEDGTWSKTFNLNDDGYNQADDRQLYIPLERLQWRLNGSYLFGDSSKFYSTLSGSLNESSNQQEPQVLIFNNRPTPLPSSYPYFPSEVLATWTDAGQEVPPQIQYYRRLNELGPRTYEQERETINFVGGVETEFGLWHSHFSYQYGRTEFSQISRGHYNTTNMAYALDVEADPNVAGGYRCAPEAARDLGCVPANIFTPGGISEAAIGFAQAEQATNSALVIKELQWRMQGPLLTLPAGTVDAVFGVDWREESITSDVDELTQSGQTSSVALSGVNGKDKLTELYTEVQVPLLVKTGVDYLGASFALRLSDYDSIGSAESWNAALTLAPTPSIKFYLRRSLAIRAPSVSELLLPPRGGNLPVSDPCAVGAVVSAQAQDNCASLGIPQAYSPTPEELRVPYTISGNTNLHEERGYTTTLGFSYKPWSDSTLVLRADYFDIKLDDAIVIMDPMFKLNSCYGSEDFPGNAFCEGFTRNGADQNFTFGQINFGPENIGEILTSGVDLELASQLPLWGGTLSNRLLLTYTDKWQESANGRTLNKLNEPGLQNWKGVYSAQYSKGHWQSSLVARHQADAVVENNSAVEYIQQNNNLPSLTYLDLHLAYHVKSQTKNSTQGGYKIYAVVNNLTDKQPPYVPGNSRSGTMGTSTAANVYDVRGRFLSVGVKYKF